MGKFRLQAGINGFGIDHIDEEYEPIFFREDWFTKNGYKPEKTVTVLNSNKQPIKIRLTEIDAPEYNQDFGEKSKDNERNSD